MTDIGAQTAVALAEIIAAAEAGDEVADRRLCVYAATLLDRNQFHEAPAQLRAYVVKFLVGGKRKRCTPLSQTD